MRKPTLLPAPTEAEDLAAHDAWIDGEGANVATTTGIWFAALAYARGRKIPNEALAESPSSL